MTRPLVGRRVVVTGATGFVGSHIALALEAAGATVVGAVRSPDKGQWLVHRNVSLVKADLTDKASLVAAFAGADAVVSNAALGSNQGDMADFERVNCQGVSDLMDAANEAGVTRIVHVSSVAVYRTRLYAAMDEATRGYPTDKRRFNWSDTTTDWRYARTKALSEQIAWEKAKAHGLELTTLRPGPVYGSRDPKATRQLVEGLVGKRFKAAPTVGVPWVHAGEVADAAVRALLNRDSIGKPYNLAGPPVSMWTFLSAMRKILVALLPGERIARLVPVPAPVWVRFDTTAASRDLGFVARPIEEGLREALEEYAAKGGNG